MSEPPRPLTAAQAFRLVAETLINTGWLDCGLCAELRQLAWHPLSRVPLPSWAHEYPDTVQLPDVEYDRATGLINELGADYDYLAPVGTHVAERAMFALLCAEILEDEDRARLTHPGSTQAAA